MAREFDSTFDVTISRDELHRLAPTLLDTLREFVNHGLCRQANTAERKALAEHFAQMAHKALKDFPNLKFNHCGAKTRISE